MSIINIISLIVIVILLITIILQLLNFYGISQSIYGTYLAFFIFIFISFLILPNKEILDFLLMMLFFLFSETLLKIF